MAEDKEDETDPVASAVAKTVPPKVWEKAYDDLIHPGAEQVGKLAGTILRAVNAAFMPVRSVVYGIEQLEPIVSEGIAKRLTDRDESDIQSPPAYLFVPAVEALRTRASVEELREMFLNLIAASMDKDRAGSAHPSFVEVLKQITMDEAQILSLFFKHKALPLWWVETKIHNDAKAAFDFGPSFSRLSTVGKDAGCAYPDSVPEYVENLLRLGLVFETRPWACGFRTAERLINPGTNPNDGRPLAGERFPDMVAQHPELIEIARGFRERDSFRVWSGEIRLTEIGKAFCRSCVEWDDPNGMMIPGSGGGQLLHNGLRV